MSIREGEIGKCNHLAIDLKEGDVARGRCEAFGKRIPWSQGIPYVGHNKPLSTSVSSDTVFSSQNEEAMGILRWKNRKT